MLDVLGRKLRGAGEGDFSCRLSLFYLLGIVLPNSPRTLRPCIKYLLAILTDNSCYSFKAIPRKFSSERGADDQHFPGRIGVVPTFLQFRNS